MLLVLIRRLGSLNLDNFSRCKKRIILSFTKSKIFVNFNNNFALSQRFGDFFQYQSYDDDRKRKGLDQRK